MSEGSYSILGAAAWLPEHREALSVPILLSTRAWSRASHLTRTLARVAHDAMMQAGLDITDVPIIVGSAFGDMDITFQLLEMCFEKSSEFSPARFQQSVHNSAVGQISVASRNRTFSTAIAAGLRTVAMTLLESEVWLEAHGGHALVLFGDAALPSVLRQGIEYEGLAAAFVLSTERRSAMGVLSRLRREDTGLAREATLAMRPWTSNPCTPALTLYDRIVNRRSGTCVLECERQDVSWSTTYTSNL
ncbi:MAG: beta-ketoacyl synthase chain length factor [Myxococcales bacterium]|nr:beta-ketoacyl synthase chain length factor [Myxococcales bacterium]MCB9708873.1 beta-ketoacyl synthase chain length factor [Myxococcales bacterium]